MPLTHCPECQGEVSDQAATCPHCGYPLHPPAAASTPPLDDTLRQLLTHGNKIAAVKLYRDQHPGASLSDCKDYVDRLEAAMPVTLRSPANAGAGGAGAGGTCLLLFCLLAVLVPSAAFWTFSHHPSTLHKSSLSATHR